jgi:nucleoside-diphosphate-sugar epimerase
MMVFITGATGYIGQHLALTLANAGHQVKALVRSPEKAKAIEHPNITFIKGSLKDLAALEAGTSGADAVFHLAAYARVWAADPHTYEKINVKGTENVLQAALKNQVKKVVVTSTAGVMGPSGETAVAENTQRQVPFFNEYEETKHRSEQICREYARHGLEVVVVNPSRVYGPGLGSDSNPVTKLIDRFVHGGWRWVPGDGKGIGSYVYIDDVVTGHLLALEKGRSGEAYLLGGENASYTSFFAKLQKVSGVRKRLFHVPVGVLLLLSNGMVFWTRITRTPPLITPKWVRKYLYHWEVSSKKAINELGYSITPLEEGIARTIAWLKEEHDS